MHYQLYDIKWLPVQLNFKFRVLDTLQRRLYYCKNIRK